MQQRASRTLFRMFAPPQPGGTAPTAVVLQDNKPPPCLLTKCLCYELRMGVIVQIVRLCFGYVLARSVRSFVRAHQRTAAPLAQANTNA
ncbi:hypothetical protein EON66_05055 [archaeon]|nr:MAG: hypothetical protein EON66_05055 [archaeon]